MYQIPMEACPFCGAALASKVHYTLYHCGTWWCESDHGWIRKDPCYERQLTQQADLLREALEVVIAYANGEYHLAIEEQAKFLIPALEAALEKMK